MNKQIVAKFSFAVFMFFSVFGTAIPFKAKVENVADIGTSNEVNQIVYIFLFLSSIFALSGKLNKIFLVVKREKFLSILLVWMFLSIFWSEYSFVSFKRYFQIFTTVTVCLAFLFYTNSFKERFLYFKYIALIYVLMTMISILFVPGAIDISGGWRGLTPQKNQLGQAALFCIIVWYGTFINESKKWKVISILLFVFSIIILIGSRSTTSFLVFLAVGVLILILSINDKLKKRLSIGNSFFVLAATSTLAFFMLVLSFAPELITAFPELFGKDSTFTGRTNLWFDIYSIAYSNIVIGYGFGGFWVVENPQLIPIYQKYIFLPRSAHMGYLDILIQTGLVGLVVFIMMVLNSIIKMRFSRMSVVWICLIFAALFSNATETTLFSPGKITGQFFLFSYLALFVGLVDQNHSLDRNEVIFNTNFYVN